MKRKPAGLAEGAERPRRLVVITGGIVTFALAFLYRFLSAEFVNDHFMHLAEGRQVLHGEWPVRDFFDFGLPLQVLTSAATLLASGYNLYGEALVTCAFIAAGAALTFMVASRLSRSVVLGLIAALVTTLSMPRLYNYPKVFWYVCALWAAWHYARQPGTRRAIILALVVALAFLYRHDHGLYIAISTLVLFVVVHWGQPRAGLKAFAIYAVTGILAITPFLLFVQLTAGLPWYIADLVPGAATSMAPRFNALAISLDRTDPLISFDQAAERRINVRWSAVTGDQRRAVLEAKYALRAARLVKDTTWSYDAADDSPANIRALLNDPAVEDTDNIDRSTSVLTAREAWYERLQRRVGLLRMHVLPGLFTPGNALAVFYYATVAIPVLALLTLLITAWRGDLPRPEGAVAAMTVLMSLVIVETLVRGSPDSRLPDVTGVIAVAAAWMTSRWLRVDGRSRTIRLTLTALLVLLLTWAVGTNGGAGEALAASRMLAGPSDAIRRFAQQRERYRGDPTVAFEAGDGGYGALARYANACTQSDDRLLVTWFEPAVYFYADRNFAGGRVFFDRDWHDTVRDQQLTVDRLRQQRVPLVFIRNDQELMFRKGFPLVAAYVDAQYSRMTPTAHAERLAGFQVWTARALEPAGTFDYFGLPCFR